MSNVLDAVEVGFLAYRMAVQKPDNIGEGALGQWRKRLQLEWSANLVVELLYLVREGFKLGSCNHWSGCVPGH